MIEFKLRDYMSPAKFLYWRKTLWESQYYTRGKLDELQHHLLSKMLDHCFENVPFYQNYYKSHGIVRQDITSVEDLVKLPIIGKNDVQEHSEEFKSTDFVRHAPRPIYTSGTTGTPLRLYWDTNSNVIELLSMWRVFSWAGYRLGEAFLDLRSSMLQGVGAYKWNWKCRGLEISSDNITEDTLEHYLTLIRKYKIKLWRGHSSSMYDFCMLLEKNGVNDVTPAYITTASETVLDYHRQYIESWAGVPIFDCYGLKEHNAFISQCQMGEYHISDEYGVVEITKDDGSAAGEGEEGRIVATGLHNKAYPLIRYDTGDYAIKTNRLCQCGRTLPLVAGLTGRNDDRILSADGRWVSGLHFAFFKARNVRQAQIVQDAANVLDVYIVPNRAYTEVDGRLVVTQIRKKVGTAMDVVIHCVSSVPYPCDGKNRFVVCKLTGNHPDNLARNAMSRSRIGTLGVIDGFSIL